jgi:hypothetical protein
MSIRNMRLGCAVAALALLSFAAGTVAQSRYPLIDSAEVRLQNALSDLQRARNLFGGHKRAAIGLINQALGELQAAKGFAASRGY